MAGGEGGCQMSILLHKPYLVKWSTKGEGGQKCLKICPHGLWMTPYSDDDDDEPMLVAEPYKPTLVPNEKFQDPYCKYKYLDMDPDMEVLVQLQAWISKMRDVKYCLGNIK